MSQKRAGYTIEGNGPDVLDELKGLPCALAYNDPGYEAPQPGQVDQLIKAAGWSQTDVAKLVGVNYNPQKGSPTVRRWRTAVDHKEHRAIPYAAWRLLLIYAGVVIEPAAGNASL